MADKCNYNTSVLQKSWPLCFPDTSNIRRDGLYMPENIELVEHMNVAEELSGPKVFLDHTPRDWEDLRSRR